MARQRKASAGKSGSNHQLYAGDSYIWHIPMPHLMLDGMTLKSPSLSALPDIQ